MSLGFDCPTVIPAGMELRLDQSEAARRACEKHGLPVLDAPVVEQMMRRPEACWSPCCNADCTPCMDDYAAAARFGQRMLRETEEALVEVEIMTVDRNTSRQTVRMPASAMYSGTVLPVERSKRPS